MTLDSLAQALDAALRPLDLLTHPFYRAWSDGCLRREDLADYAAQYAHAVEALPALLRTTQTTTDDAETRDTLARNLDDEEGRTGPAHAALWQAFARAVGSVPAPARDETRASQDALAELAREDETTALAALWAYEVQTARVAETKRVGLARYGVTDAPAVAFFRLHQALDVHHARELLEGVARSIGRGGSLEDACEAVRRSAQAQWTFLDGVERVRQSRIAA